MNENELSPSVLIDKKISDLNDWRGNKLSIIRNLIKEIDSEITEEYKWMGTPVWYHNGIICTGEIYKNIVKMTFANGASLNDPTHLFNSSLDGKVRRAIDLHENDSLNENDFQSLILEAIAFNENKKLHKKN